MEPERTSRREGSRSDIKAGVLGNTLLNLGAIFALAAAQPAHSSAYEQAADDPGYRRYQLIDLGTLGGSKSGQVFPARTLNNRGQYIAQSSTGIPDPYDCIWDVDCSVWHGMLREPNGAVTDLGALPGLNHAIGTWITDGGWIMGLSTNGLIDPLTDFPQMRAVAWDRDGAIVDLGTLGGNASQASSMNDRGQIVGLALNDTPEDPGFAEFMNGFLPAATQVRAFLWQNGSMQDLGTLGGTSANATVINQRGQVLGLSYTDTVANETTGLPTAHPFLWSEGRMHDLGSLGGTLAIPGSFATGYFGQILNQRGQAVGTSTLAGDETWHAFLWTNGTMIDLGTLGGSFSEALAINESGQVVGRASTVASRHPFLWDNGTMIDLGVVAPCQRGSANSINSKGQIVGGLGRCTDNPADITFFSAFLWERGRPIVDLNTLLAEPSELHIEDAAIINDRGEIGGVGIGPDGEPRAILLVPLPGSIQ